MSKTSKARYSIDRSQPIPTPKAYIREVNITDHTLPANLANNGLTAVMPAHSSTRYRGALFVVHNLSGEPYAYNSSDLIAYRLDTDTVDEIPKERMIATFIAGAKVRLEVHVWVYDNVWALGTPSDEITII